MRIAVRGLDKGYVYPCTRREAVDAFGKDVLDSISFGSKFQWHKRDHGGASQPFQGKVLADVYVTDWEGYADKGIAAWMHIYYVSETEFPENVGHQLVRNFKAVMLPWAIKSLKEMKQGNYKNMQLIAGFNAAGFFLYEFKHREFASEKRQLEVAP